MSDQYERLMKAVDDFGDDCGDRVRLPYKYGEHKYGDLTPYRAAVEREARILEASAAFDAARWCLPHMSRFKNAFDAVKYYQRELDALLKQREEG